MPPLPNSVPVNNNENSGQFDFSKAIFHPELPTPDGIVGPDGKISDKRFSVYRNNVTLSLIEAMAANFPVIQRLVGEEFFTALARAFIQQHPPEVPMLFLYGKKFAAFLEAFEPVAEYPYLADVARVEFSWLQSYHAADVEVVDGAELGAVAAEDIGNTGFNAHPASWIFRSIWPVGTIVARNREEGDCSDIDLSLGEDILITRPLLDVDTRILPVGGYDFLSALISGGTLGEAAATAIAVDDTFDLSMQIAGMLECGVFCEIHSSNEAEQARNV